MLDETTKNPEGLLAAAEREKASQGRGRLKVFVGMCPGVGKTYAMLEAAHREAKASRKVVVGCVETHGRKETEALVAGLTLVPRRSVQHRGVRLEEMDLDAILARSPRLVLVDELAHANAPGSRHPKRWQDVVELLDAGIDVFATLNVQHVESRADAVRQITGIEVRETVRDSILDDAVLELVDLPPEELVRRLREGKVYLPDSASAALGNFFREPHLTALRELALRLVADHVGGETVELRGRQRAEEPWRTANLLLVAVGPSPFSEGLVRRTRRMADELRCRWLAVHVEGPRPISDAARARLTRNLQTARELGAEVITTTDEDWIRGLLRVARERNVTQIVLGKPANDGVLDGFRGGRVMRRLLRRSGDIDLHVIRAERAASHEPASGSTARPTSDVPRLQYLWATVAVLGVGLLNVGISELSGPRVPGLLFLLVVVFLALFVGRGPVLLAGTLSALAWNFFFLPPKWSFRIDRIEDWTLFGTYFLVALVLGQLVARIRIQAEAERTRERRSSALYELTRDLAEATSRDEVVWRLIDQTGLVFGVPATVVLPSGDRWIPHPDGTLSLTDKELSVCDWAFRRRKPAGRFTDTLPGASALHLPLATDRRAFGVLVVGCSEPSLAMGQRDLLEAFARQASLVLDRLELRAEAEKSRWFAESERLGRVLLNSISHELRTPLAASTSAASALATLDADAPDTRRLLVAEIQEANARLNRVVGNLLDVARLESGKVVPRLDWHDLRDVVQTTLRELETELAGHPLEVVLPEQPVLVRIDFSLMHHALANLLVNAATHTPKGTMLEVRVEAAEDASWICVADRGPGIPPEVLPRIFEKFVRASTAPTGGTGLGLTIAKGFVEAQGGRIVAENRPAGGAALTLRLPRTAGPVTLSTPE